MNKAAAEPLGRLLPNQRKTRHVICPRVGIYIGSRKKVSDANIDHAVLVTGLERFAGLWKKHNGGLVTKRLEGALGRELRCESIEGSVASLLLWRDTAEIFVSDSRRNTPHAVVRMSSSDWEKVLSGESHIMAVILAGRAPFPKDQRRLLMQFSMLLQTTLLTRNER